MDRPAYDESWLKTNAEKKQDNEIRFQMPGIILGSNLCKPTEFDYSDEVVAKGDKKSLADNYRGNLVSFESVFRTAIHMHCGASDKERGAASQITHGKSATAVAREA